MRGLNPRATDAGSPELYLKHPVISVISCCFKYGPARQTLENVAHHLKSSEDFDTASGLYKLLAQTCVQLHRVTMPDWYRNCGVNTSHHGAFLPWLLKWGLIRKGMPQDRQGSRGRRGHGGRGGRGGHGGHGDRGGRGGHGGRGCRGGHGDHAGALELGENGNLYHVVPLDSKLEAKLAKMLDVGPTARTCQLRPTGPQSRQPSH